MAKIAPKAHKNAMLIVVITGFMMITSCVCADNLLLVDHYSDNFGTDRVSYDSFEHSLMWLDKTFPVEAPHLILKEIDGDSGLLFTAYEGDPATLGYSLPVDQQVKAREVSWIVEVDLDVRLSMNQDPAHPVMGYLVYKTSPDGLTWSDPYPLKHGQNQLSLGLLSQARYLVFLGSNAAIISLNIDLYEPKATILVPDHVRDIQAAINLARNGDRILVAEGRYYGQGNTNLDFGGKSILLMSAGEPENCVLDGEGQRRGVLFQSGESNETVIDGFTITNCLGTRGGGILCSNASPTISNCIIKACRAEDDSGPARGGGLFVEGGHPVVKHCTFESNTADGLGQGGAICVAGNASIEVLDTVFFRNQANQLGQADSGGGAVYLMSTTTGLVAPARFQQCLFYANVAQTNGGVFYLARAPVSIESCTLANNRAQGNGGGIYVDHTIASGQTNLISHCILWNNASADLYLRPSVPVSSVVVEYSNLGEAWDGPGNLSEDPLFADSDYHDYHLLSHAGRYDPSNQWTHDDPSSPCIDAGNPAVNTAAERTPHGRRINMGAYGGTAQASRGSGARVFHVDTESGSDSNLGLQWDTAFASISQAVDIASDGDYVLVWPGVYHEEISYAGKAITIQSAADAATVTAPSGYAFAFNQGEGPGSVLRNLILSDCPTGAVFCEVASPTLQNLTIVNNRIGINAEENANPSISSCVFWHNLTGDVFGCRANYSCLLSPDGIGNLNRNPLFADFNGRDYHLRSKYGRYWPEHRVWIVDEASSPCLDRGAPGVHPYEEPQYNGGRLNQGAYTGTGFASMSPPHNLADINADGMVDFLDFAEFAESWLLP
ncbi:MAG: right-handed parallel beta-helix repeat-containing protein [Phycisphaeraceae bacterium]|nr:right-handed parallel beta-helix repeat-containing protein [Phycisphaeraceae bacterium]